MVVDIAAADEELIRRLTSRRVCGQCGANADGRALAPGVEGPVPTACGKCGGALTQRADDREEVIRERLRVYARDTRPLIDYYRRRPTFRSVNGAQEPSAVARRPRGGGERGRGGGRLTHDRLQVAGGDRADARRQRAGRRGAHRPQGDAIGPGVSTGELDERAEATIRAAGATPAFKGYHGYPATLCVSINEEVIHGIPSRKRLLTDGDIVSVDVGAVLDGFVGDSAVTFPVGAISERAARLLRVTQEALYGAILAVKPGGRVSDIGHAVQRHVEANGCSVVREFVGHGIGTVMHEEPQVPNYGPPGRGAKLTDGMVLAIEPMVNLGRPAVRVLDDGWTAVTRDRSLSAHFEHTVAVTGEGPLVLTARGDETVRRGPGRGRVCDRRRGGDAVAKDDAIEVTGVVRRGAPERDVPGRTREQASGAGARFGQDAEELHPHPHGRPRADRTVALRPDAGPYHVSVQVSCRLRSGLSWQRTGWQRGTRS